jgi:cytoskeletal protein CcmA (bactofilin family)
MQIVRGWGRSVGAGVAVWAVLAVGLHCAAFGATFEQGITYELPEDEVIEDDLYVGCQKSVVIKGTVKGDVFAAAGQSIDVSGVVEGALTAVGGSLDMSGTVEGDLNAAGQSITMSGECKDDARLAASMLTVSGTIADDLFAASPKLTLKKKCRVHGDAFVGGTEADIDENARIDGTLTVALPAAVEIPDGVAGEVVRKAAPEMKKSSGGSIVGWVVYTIASIAGFVLLGWAVHWFVPGLVNRPAEAIHKSPLNATLYGLVGAGLFTLLPLATCALAVMVLFQGPEAAAGMVMATAGVVLVLWNVSPLVTGCWLKKRFSGGDGQDKLTALRSFLMWVLIIAVLGRIPYAGHVVYLASFVIAAGGIILALKPGKPVKKVDTPEPPEMPQEA